MFNNNQLVLSLTVVAIVHLVTLLQSAQSLILTSVIAGDKKFKTISFDSKFLPALKFEKPLLLPTEFRRHRTLRPPKFDIDVNIPIKLPMEEEYPQEDDYQSKKPIESNFFFQTTDVQDDNQYAKKSNKPSQYNRNVAAQKLYAAASTDYQQPVSLEQQPHHHQQLQQQHQQQQQQTDNPKSIQDILQRPEDKASNKFSDGIDGAADSTKISSVATKNNNNNNQQSIIGDSPALAQRRSPDRRQQHNEQQLPSLLPLLNNLRSMHRARSLWQHHDQINSRSSEESAANYPSDASDKMTSGQYATIDTGSSSSGAGYSGQTSGQDQGLESAIGYQPSSYQPSSSSSSYTSADSNSPSPTSTYQHMGTQYYTRPGYMHHFQNHHTQLGQGDSGQDLTTYSGMTNQQTSNMDQDYLSTQMTSNQNQQQQYANNIEQQQQQQQQPQHSQYSPQQQALINAYIMQHHHQQQQLQSAANKQQQHQLQQQQQQQNVYMYPGQSANSATYSNQQQQQQDSQQPQSMPSELQPMVASSNDQQSQNSDNSQSAHSNGNQNDLQSSQTQQQQYDSNNQMASLQQAESHNDYQKQQYGGKNNQQYYQQEFVPGGYINLQLKGPEGGPKMTYADYDRERWAQQVSQATGAMPNHVLNYQQLQNYYGGLGTFTNGLSDRYVGPMGILDKLKSSLHTLTSKLHLG